MTDKQKSIELATAIEDAIDKYISPDNKGYRDFFYEHQSYETGHEVKLSIKKVKYDRQRVDKE